jgi:hypothetical protein
MRSDLRMQNTQRRNLSQRSKQCFESWLRWLQQAAFAAGAGTTTGTETLVRSCGTIDDRSNYSSLGGRSCPDSGLADRLRSYLVLRGRGFDGSSVHGREACCQKYGRDNKFGQHLCDLHVGEMVSTLFEYTVVENERKVSQRTWHVCAK